MADPPWSFSTARTAARMTALSPGQSPPPVRIPIRMRVDPTGCRRPITSVPMSIVIALDAGTTGVRAFAVDERGRAVGYRYREFRQFFPRPGWVEHDAEEIRSAIVGTAAELIAAIGEPIAAIGITDQRETVVAWSRSTGRPLHR